MITSSIITLIFTKAK